MSSSTQALQIKPKTAALPSWSTRITGQLLWPGGSFSQVRTILREEASLPPACFRLLQRKQKPAVRFFALYLSLGSILNSPSFFLIANSIPWSFHRLASENYSLCILNPIHMHRRNLEPRAIETLYWIFKLKNLLKFINQQVSLPIIFIIRLIRNKVYYPSKWRNNKYASETLSQWQLSGILLLWLPSNITNSMDMNLSKLLELVMDREARRAAVQAVAKNWTQLSNWTV